MINRRILRILILALISALIGGSWGLGKLSQKDRYKNKDRYLKVLKVHDGDTITINLSGKREKVRLIGIDAPEIGQRPWGMRAKRYLEGVLGTSGMAIRLEFDVEERDKYGRLLAYAWTKDGRLINKLMLEDGYAMLLTIPPNIKYVDEFRRAQASARGSKKGIWGRSGLRQSPSEFRKGTKSPVK